MTQPAALHNLPSQLTPFIGRADEVARISGLLVGPACRLLTLAGAGGVGKTRLALQVAAGLQARFAHGVYFVSLQPIRSLEFLVPAIAHGLNFALSGQAQPRLQLLDYLSDKAMLLVLDNFEQLLPEGGAELLLDMLKAAPAVKLLVTSREVLNLQEEQVYPVQGMPFPSSAYRGDIQDYSAVALFVERARRVRPDFSPRDEQAGLIRICQLVEGVPLAIERAAAWTKTLRCAAIAWTARQESDRHIQWTRDFWTAMQPFSTGGGYVNFISADEGQERVRAAYGPDKYRRLVALKNEYDPGNFFRVNQNIRPWG